MHLESCGILATQRIAKLHKDAAAECNNVLVGRTVMDIDRKRASNDLGFSKKDQEMGLKKLKDGEFFGYGPAISKDDYIRVQVGGVKTKHPEPGRNFIKTSKTPENIKKLLKDVINLPKEVETELKTKKEFQNKIQELKRELRLTKTSQPKPIADEKAFERARQSGFRESEKSYLGGLKLLENQVKSYKMGLNQIVTNCNKMLQIKEATPIQESRPLPEVKVTTPTPQKYVPPKRTPIQDSENGDIKLNLAEKKIYSLLCQYPDKELSRKQIGVFTGYAYRGGGFQNALYKLNVYGLIERKGEFVRAKAIDENLIGEFNFSIQEIIGRLNKCEREIYDVVVEQPEKEFTREEIAELTPSNYEPKGGGFQNALYKLNTYGIIEKQGSSIKLNPELLEL